MAGGRRTGKPQRCIICGEPFEPDPRSRGRQTVCGRAACKKEAQRRRCRSWNERNPDYFRQRNLAERLLKDAAEEEGEQSLYDRIDWDALSEIAGPAMGLIIQELAHEQKVLVKRLEKRMRKKR